MADSTLREILDSIGPDARVVARKRRSGEYQVEVMYDSPKQFGHGTCLRDLDFVLKVVLDRAQGEATAE